MKKDTKATLLALALFLAFPAAALAQSIYTDTTAEVETGVGAGTVETDADVEVTGSLEAGDTATTSVESDSTLEASLGGDGSIDVYVGELRAQDERVVSAEVDSDNDVSVHYTHQGKFLGMFPVDVKTKTTVAQDSQGEVMVKTHMPWWSVFVSGLGSVRASVEERLTSNTTFMADTKMRAQADAQQRLIEAIVSAHANAHLSTR